MVDTRFYTVAYPQGFCLEDLCSWCNDEDNIDLSGLQKLPTLKGVSDFVNATKEHIIYFDTKALYPQLQQSKAVVCLTTRDLANNLPKHMQPIVCQYPRRTFSAIGSALFKLRPLPLQGESPIDASAKLQERVMLGANVVIGADVRIGENTIIGANTVIGPGVTIGSNCIIEPNCTIICADIGDEVRIGSGTRIGQEGFGFVMDERGHISVPHLGQVLIENQVKIGANCCIDRAALGVTWLKVGCRLDNLIQVAHNVEIGKNSVLAAQVGVAGSTKIGNFVVIGGQAGFTQHLTVHDGAQIAAQSGIMSDIPAKTVYSGSPAVPIGQWRRQNVLLRKMVKKGA